jgi:hypothetical protein
MKYGAECLLCTELVNLVICVRATVTHASLAEAMLVTFIFHCRPTDHANRIIITSCWQQTHQYIGYFFHVLRNEPEKKEISNNFTVSNVISISVILKISFINRL